MGTEGGFKESFNTGGRDDVLLVKKKKGFKPELESWNTKRNESFSGLSIVQAR